MSSAFTSWLTGAFDLEELLGGGGREEWVGKSGGGNWDVEMGRGGGT